MTGSLPTLWSAHSVLGAYKFLYVLAVDLKHPLELGLTDLGLAVESTPGKGGHVAWEYFPECWRNQTAADRGTCAFELGAGHTAALDASRSASAREAALVARVAMVSGPSPSEQRRQSVMQAD